MTSNPGTDDYPKNGNHDDNNILPAGLPQGRHGSLKGQRAGSERGSHAKSALRTTLLTRRAQLKGAALEAADTALSTRIHALLEQYAPRCVGFYWSTAGEFDACAVVANWLTAVPACPASRIGATRSAALPVVMQPRAPLAFYAWQAGATMQRGRYGILQPAHGIPVAPDLLLIPCVGFDPTRFRLGYGGGYYDRTLAACTGRSRPVAIGVAYEVSRVDALPHEPHDIQLDRIVTEAACY